MKVTLIGKYTLDSVEDVVVDESDGLKEERWGDDGCDEDDKLDVGGAGGVVVSASERDCNNITCAADLNSSRATRKFQHIDS